MKRILTIFLSVILAITGLFSVKAFAANDNDLSNVKVGDTITLGFFEQDGDEDNGDEAIEWLVLSVDDSENKALVISKYGLYLGMYTMAEAPITWEESPIREFLNEEFVYDIFDENELSRLIPTVLENDDHDYGSYSVPGGEDTEDLMFILSVDEAKEYFPDDESRKCIATEFALMNDVWVVTEEMVKERPFAYSEDMIGYSTWWLRGPGASDQCASIVLADGSIPDYGVFGLSYREVLRPSMWISLD